MWLRWKRECKAREKAKGKRSFLVSNTSKVGNARKILGGRLAVISRRTASKSSLATHYQISIYINTTPSLTVIHICVCVCLFLSLHSHITL